MLYTPESYGFIRINRDNIPLDWSNEFTFFEWKDAANNYGTVRTKEAFKVWGSMLEVENDNRWYIRNLPANVIGDKRACVV